MNKYVWIVQNNMIESTDDIKVFSTKKRALEWLEEYQEPMLCEDGEIIEGIYLYSSPSRTYLNPTL